MQKLKKTKSNKNINKEQQELRNEMRNLYNKVTSTKKKQKER